MFNSEDIKRDFPILSTEVNKRKLVYLDSGATAQKPLQVIAKMDELLLSCNGNIHRGAHSMSNRVTEQYELSREIIRDFIGAKSSKNIVFTSGTTASINLVSYSYGSFISEGDEVIVSEMEHHSNIVPWQLLCQRTGAVLRVVPFNDKGEIVEQEYLDLLSEKTKIVAFTAASNVLGTMPNLDFIIKKAHECGAKVLIDACQAIVHSKIDVEAMDCDFLVFSGHKLYGPTGIGILYAKEELLEAMPPFMGGGDMVDTVTFAKTTYAELPLKFEAGTTNYIAAIGLGEAIKYINSIDFVAALKHENELRVYATEQLQSLSGFKLYGEAERKSAIVSFNFDSVHPFDIALLLDKQGVAVRSGTHCAQPVMQHFGMTGCVRASLGIYNTVEDVDILIKSTKTALSMLL